ncbi:hypothetical protein DSECCO2_418750 [anaerobic digester metagenome]
MLPGEFRDLGRGVLDAGARLVVDHRDDLGPGLEFPLKTCKIEGRPPLGLEEGDHTVTLTYLCKTFAELTVDERDDPSVPCKVCDGGLHTGAPGAADDVEVVCGAKKGL